MEASGHHRELGVPCPICNQALSRAEIEEALAVTAASPLAALVAKVDEEGFSGASVEQSTARHKALVRAAGRAAIEETMRPTRTQAEMELSSESLVAEWVAYAEVFGTNGLASGGARSATGNLPAARSASGEGTGPNSRSLGFLVREPPPWVGAAILTLVALVLVGARRQPQGGS
mmetsp:Transcript_50828/g.108537  ORF Transcript_50828/g.108537 Transcript_50828/m.108537 type:complete len:175 (-) Transcript_50828:70-594(-)